MPIVVFKSVLVYWHFKNRDMYNEKFEFWVNSVNELILVIISLIFIIFYFVQDSITAQVEYDLFGNLMIGMFMLMMIFNLVFALIEIFSSIKSALTKKKGKKSTQSN